MTPPIPVLSRPEAARYLGISIRMLDRLKAERKIRATRIGRRVLYRLTVLEAFLERHTDLPAGTRQPPQPARYRPPRRTTEEP